MNKLFPKALIIENLKRFKGIAFAAFIYYFMCGPFVILTGSGPYCADAIGPSNFGYGFGALVLPIVVSAAVFSYLYKVSSVSTLHSQPYTRAGLYCGNVLSGLIICVMPALLTTAIFFVLRNTVTFVSYSTAEDGGMAGMMPEILKLSDYVSAKDILIWLVIHLVTLFFVYAICCFAAMLTGNGVVHVLTCLGLNFVLPIVVLAIDGFAYEHLYGFEEPDLEWIEKLHPLISFAVSREGALKIKAITYILYTAIALVVLLLGYYVYKHRQMENTGDSYVFEIVGVVIGLILVFIGSSGFGMVFGEDGYLAYIIAGLLTLVVSQMIIQKTAKIFNRKTFKALVLSLIMMALVIGGFMLDPLGVENRMPDAQNVERAVYTSYVGPFPVELVMTEEEGIEAVRDIHEYFLTDGKDRSDNDYYGSNAHIAYELKNGKTLRRTYSIYGNQPFVIPTMNDAVNVSDFRDFLDYFASMDVNKADVFASYYEEETGINYEMNEQMSAQDKAELLKCICMDLADMDWLAAMTDNSNAVGSVSFCIYHPVEDFKEREKNDDMSKLAVRYCVYNFEDYYEDPSCREDFDIDIYPIMKRSTECLKKLSKKLDPWMSDASENQ